MSVVIETTKGIFTVDLYTEQRPKTCKNFLKLCKVKYYNYSLFHSVQANFIAQTGDPTGIGRNGGESIFRRLYGDQATFYEGELLPKIKHTKRGQISMVTVGNNLFGSQFFITLADDLDYLDGNHCVFGEIVEGLDEILQAFNEAICDEEHRPYQDIRIAHTVILDDPFEDPPGLEIPDRSPPPSKEMLASTRIGADEDLDDYEGMDDKEIAEMMAEKEAKAQATILEMIGDLPEADVAPPENVLFVCKLNPVTTDDDLEIIFSRFGKVKSCEVIRDRKTGDSLQYAFVEFEDEKSCEKAYFKMDNVLIDDRRIHVDFSQSVSKYQWKGKGRLEIFDEKTGKPSKDDTRGSRNERSNQNTDRPRQQQHPKDSRSFDRRDYSRNEARNGRRDDTYDRDRDSDRRRDDKYERKRDDSRDRRNGEDRQKDRKRDFSPDRQKDRKRESSVDRQKDRTRDRSRDRNKDGNRKHHESRDKRKDQRRDDSSDRKYDRKTRDDSRDRKKDRKKTKDQNSDSSDGSEYEHSRKSSKKKEKKNKRDRSRSNSRERHSKKHKNY